MSIQIPDISHQKLLKQKTNEIKTDIVVPIKPHIGLAGHDKNISGSSEAW